MSITNPNTTQVIHHIGVYDTTEKFTARDEIELFYSNGLTARLIVAGIGLPDRQLALLEESIGALVLDASQTSD